ncbi:hypothetical protein CARUB_v10023878mg [Capsella rubella]|uniref:WRC domain-containing protein n=1 Tax=Capsella rubella TaxID=81985 RepID=R0HQZ2_9BRAS|nr:uncharacterized protein LOC17889148 [Capsella rubella]EOA27725.1 hypothetical protein CARUB_v10023878mg [Capsella rubella]
MRIRKRQVPLPLSSLLPVPLSDLYFNRSPTATARYFCGGYRDGDGAFASFQLQPPSPVSDRLIQRDLLMKKEQVKALDDDVDVKSRTDASSSKNVRSRGEPDPSTQVIEKNDKVVTLRKRRGFINFEDYEDEDEEEASGGSKGKKKTKKNGGGGLEEGSRCSRVNGRGWRCCQQTLVGYSLCEHHLGKGRVRSTNKSGGGRGGEKKAAAVEVKKKRVKLGMVKARSISSLLGQTSTSGGNAADVESEISAPADQFAAYDK